MVEAKNTQNMQVLIATPFKCGSMSLLNTLLKMGIEAERFHDLQFTKQPTHIIIVDREVGPGWWLSGLFQDIDNPAYPYYFSTSQEEILKTTPDVILAHFHKFNWAEMPQFQIEPILAQVEEIFGLEIKEHGVYKVDGRQILFTSLDQFVNDTSIISNFLGIGDIVLERDNIGSTKWYAPVYTAVRQLAGL